MRAWRRRLDLVVTGAGVTLTHQVTVSLLVNTPATSVPNLVSPADGTIDVPVIDVVLQWDAVAGATSYQYKWMMTLISALR
jgi:hypothetical protein